MAFGKQNRFGQGGGFTKEGITQLKGERAFTKSGLQQLGAGTEPEPGAPSWVGLQRLTGKYKEPAKPLTPAALSQIPTTVGENFTLLPGVREDFEANPKFTLARLGDRESLNYYRKAADLGLLRPDPGDREQTTDEGLLDGPSYNAAIMKAAEKEVLDSMPLTRGLFGDITKPSLDTTSRDDLDKMIAAKTAEYLRAFPYDKIPTRSQIDALGLSDPATRAALVEDYVTLAPIGSVAAAHAASYGLAATIGMAAFAATSEPFLTESIEVSPIATMVLSLALGAGEGAVGHLINEKIIKGIAGSMRAVAESSGREQRRIMFDAATQLESDPFAFSNNLKTALDTPDVLRTQAQRSLVVWAHNPQTHLVGVNPNVPKSLEAGLFSQGSLKADHATGLVENIEAPSLYDIARKQFKETLTPSWSGQAKEAENRWVGAKYKTIKSTNALTGQEEERQVMTWHGRGDPNPAPERFVRMPNGTFRDRETGRIVSGKLSQPKETTLNATYKFGDTSYERLPSGLFRNLTTGKIERKSLLDDLRRAADQAGQVEVDVHTVEGGRYRSMPNIKVMDQATGDLRQRPLTVGQKASQLFQEQLAIETGTKPKPVSFDDAQGMLSFSNPWANPVLWAKYPQAFGAGIGAGIGAAQDKEHPLRGALEGAALGYTAARAGTAATKFMRGGGFGALREMRQSANRLTGRELSLGEALNFGMNPTRFVPRPSANQILDLQGKDALKRYKTEFDINASTLGMYGDEKNAYIKSVTGKDSIEKLTEQEAASLAETTSRRVATLQLFSQAIPGSEFQSIGSVRREMWQSMRTSLNRMGSQGQRMVQLMDTVDREAVERTGAKLADLKEIIADLHSEAKTLNKSFSEVFDNWRDTLRGRTTGFTQKIEDLAAQERRELDATFDEAAQLEVKTARSGQPRKDASPIGRRENYLTQIPKTEKIEAVVLELNKRVMAGEQLSPEAAAQLKQGTKLLKRLGKGNTEATDRILKHLQKINPETGKAYAETPGEALRILHKYLLDKRVRRGRFIEHSRELDLPDEFIETNPVRILATYYYDSYRRLAEIRHLGETYQVLDEVIAKLPSGPLQDYATRARQSWVGLDVVDHDYARALANIRGLEVLSQLGLAQTLNFGQRGNIILRTKRFKQIVPAFFGLKQFSPAARTEALRGGAWVETALREIVGESIGGIPWFTAKFLKGTAMTPIEKANRVLAYHAGREHAALTFEEYVKLIKKDAPAAKRARWEKELRTLEIDPFTAIRSGKLSEGQLRRAGLIVSDESQFTSRALDMPIWYSEHKVFGRLLAQFKTFAFQHAKFVKDNLFGERKNVKSWLVFATVFPVVGEIVGDVRGVLNGRMVDREKMDFLDRLADNYSLMGALGIMSDIAKGATYGPEGVASTLFPVAVTDASAGVYALTQAVRGKPENLGKFLYKHVPFFGKLDPNLFSSIAEANDIEEQLRRQSPLTVALARASNQQGDVETGSGSRLRGLLDRLEGTPSRPYQETINGQVHNVLPGGVDLGARQPTPEDMLNLEQRRAAAEQQAVQRARSDVGDAWDTLPEVYKLLRTSIAYQAGSTPYPNWLRAVQAGDERAIWNESLTRSRDDEGNLVPHPGRRRAAFEQLGLRTF